MVLRMSTGPELASEAPNIRCRDRMEISKIPRAARPRTTGSSSRSTPGVSLYPIDLASVDWAEHVHAGRYRTGVVVQIGNDPRDAMRHRRSSRRRAGPLDSSTSRVSSAARQGVDPAFELVRFREGSQNARISHNCRGSVHPRLLSQARDDPDPNVSVHLR